MHLHTRALVAAATLLAITLLLLAAAPAGVHAGPPTIIAKDGYFVEETSGKRFIVKGVAYQPLYGGAVHDPISNDRRAAWSRDLPWLAGLGANVVRVYDVDPAQPHDQFMAALADRGMYLVLDLASAGQPTDHVDRDAPSYTLPLLNRYLDTVDAFAEYTNVLGFLVGNEVSDTPGDATRAAAYVKALVRDIRQYLAANKKRAIPLGYAASDNAATRGPNMQFFVCGKEGAVDWYGANIYSWCLETNQTFATSGYADRTRELATLGVPVVLTEFGCNVARPRTFPDVPSIFGPDMNQIVSGGIAYEYSEEANLYGLVRLAGPDSDVVTPLPDYENLKDKWERVSKSSTPFPQRVSTKNTATRPSCPAVDRDWRAASSPLPKTPSECACQRAEAKATESCRPMLPRNWTSTDKVAFLNQLCGTVACTDIGASDDVARGQYAALSGCTVETKIAWALGAYYAARNKDPAACNFGGLAVLSAGSSGGDGGRASTNDGCKDRVPPASKSGSGGSGGSSEQSGAAAAVVRAQVVAVAAALVAAWLAVGM
ncbi:1 3-beta-glucanosyltransferase gel4 [Blastocladiella emersonii ATCC 22665]|nr:1 3-beta-glucanosyltransferase gel4 [Blastocladiella emersonii ATCC 22665]